MVSENSVIPEAAVEAAARALGKADLRGGFAKDDYADALTALEAAMPHLLADAKAAAWDECEAAKYDIRLNSSGDAWEAVKDNPYSPTP